MARAPGHEPVTVLGGMTGAVFLARYWQKRPLLVRGALPDFRDPLTRDELAGLATERDVESRLVLARGGGRPWEVVRGPQDPARLRQLPRSHWTLLVEGADAHVPALADLLDSFAFLPRWRVDDVMVSFAPAGGTVGPHLDRYDVFLLQGQGRRRWQIDEAAPETCRPGLDLQILRSFRPTSEWVVGPGDVLYLPPGLAHYGVALEESLTYSIGFRAPRTSDLLLACLERMARRADPNALYEDADVEAQREPGEINARTIDTMRGMLADAWDAALSAHLPRFAGEILTTPTGRGSVPRQRRLRPEEVGGRLQRGDVLVRDPASRAAYVQRGRAADLFVDGRAYTLPASVARAAPLLTRFRRVGVKGLAPLLRRRPLLTVLADLVNAGSYALEPARLRGVVPRATRPPSSGSRRAKGTRSRGGRR